MTRAPRLSRPTLTLLAELLAAPRAWRHGYDLSQATRLKSGTLYPLLIRLDEGGFLESRWEPSELEGRPPRHAYRLTQNGVSLAKEARARAPHAALPLMARCYLACLCIGYAVGHFGQAPYPQLLCHLFGQAPLVFLPFPFTLPFASAVSHGAHYSP